MESNCTVVLLIRSIMRLWTAAFGWLLLCETLKLQCGQCCCSFLGLQCATSWTILHSMSNLCLNCTSNTENKLVPHLPTGQAPSQYIHGLISCSPCALVGGTWCFPLTSCSLLVSRVFWGKGCGEKTQEFCLILANTIMTKPLNCVPCRALSPLLTQPWQEAHKERGAWAAAEMPPFLFLPTQMICFATQHSRALGN